MDNHANVYAALRHSLSEPLILPSTRRASVAIVIRDAPSPSEQQSNSPSPEAQTDEQLSRKSSLPEVLLMQRAPNPNDPWSAHIAFPGGRQEAKDRSDLETAVREAREEMGLHLDDPEMYELIGRLDDRHIIRNVTNTYVLCAFVFRQLGRFVPMFPHDLQHEEVASGFWISLDALQHNSPTVCFHLMQKRPPRTSTFRSRSTFFVQRFLGLTKLRMPAVDVLKIAADRIHAKREYDAHPVPQVMLWGLTLSCIGDIVASLGLRRVDWPKAMPESRILGGLVWFCTEIWLNFKQSVARIYQV